MVVVHIHSIGRKKEINRYSLVVVIEMARRNQANIRNHSLVAWKMMRKKLQRPFSFIALIVLPYSCIHKLPAT